MTCDRLVVSSPNKTDRHDITEILLNVALNTINPKPTIYLACKVFDVVYDLLYSTIRIKPKTI